MCVNLGTEVVAEDGNIWKRIVSNLSSTIGRVAELRSSKPESSPGQKSGKAATNRTNPLQQTDDDRASLGSSTRCLAFLYKFLLTTP